MRKVISAGLMMIGCLWMGAAGLAADSGAPEGQGIPPVVAKVNGKEITAGEFLKAWRQMGLAMGGPSSVQDPKERETNKQNVMERLIDLELLTQKVEQMKIQVDPKKVEQGSQELEERVGGKEALDSALKDRGYTREEYMADLSMSLRIHSLLQKELFDKIVLDPNEAKRYYEANPERFVTPEQVRARHILIMVPQNATDEKRAEARQAIEKAAQRIRAGEPFEAVAREVSQDGSAQKGGDLGYFTRGRMVPEFEKAAFALEKGQLSGVVETRFGYHLIKVEDRRPPRTVSFDEAKEEIEKYLYHQKQAEAVRGYIKGLRAQAVVEMKAF